MTTANSNDCWGPWIEHDGNGCPVVIGTRVFACGHLVHSSLRRYFDAIIGPESFQRPNAWWWSDYGEPITIDGKPYLTGRLIRYKLRRSPATDKLIREAIEAAKATKFVVPR